VRPRGWTACCLAALSGALLLRPHPATALLSTRTQTRPFPQRKMLLKVKVRRALARVSPARGRSSFLLTSEGPSIATARPHLALRLPDPHRQGGLSFRLCFVLRSTLLTAALLPHLLQIELDVDEDDKVRRRSSPWSAIARQRRRTGPSSASSR